MEAIQRNLTAMLAIALAIGACAADAPVEAPHVKVVYAPTTSSANPGEDFVDAKGRKWICMGKVEFQQVDVAATESTAPPPNTATKPVSSMTVAELAEKLRPRRLVGQYEYRLAEPDYYVAEKILSSVQSGSPMPTTEAHAPMTAAVSDTGLSAQWIIGTDDRVKVGSPQLSPWSSWGAVSQSCTATMIGRSTALSAAHCYFNNATWQWTTTNWIAFGADNTTGTMTAPFGQYVFDSITIPGDWINDGVHDWDFAVLEFSPTRYPGDSTGWRGTELSSAGLQECVGYPTDKSPFPQSWYKNGYYNFPVGARYNHTLDIMPGDSGACIENMNGRCTSIQVSHYFDSNGQPFNESRQWDWTTYYFFDAYGNWP